MYSAKILALALAFVLRLLLPLHFEDIDGCEDPWEHYLSTKFVLSPLLRHSYAGLNSVGVYASSVSSITFKVTMVGVGGFWNVVKVCINWPPCRQRCVFSKYTRTGTSVWVHLSTSFILSPLLGHTYVGWNMLDSFQIYHGWGWGGVEIQLTLTGSLQRKGKG